MEFVHRSRIAGRFIRQNGLAYHDFCSEIVEMRNAIRRDPVFWKARPRIPGGWKRGIFGLILWQRRSRLELGNPGGNEFSQAMEG